MATEITVSVLNKTYPIIIGHGLKNEISEWIDSQGLNTGNAAVITDDSIVNHQSDWLSQCFGDLPRFSFPSGEATKSIQNLEICCEFLAEQKLDRNAVLFCVGGGVIGDLGGFAAASYLRGIRFVQVPTTILSMVDSSVGGKTGVNIPSGKNLVGAFHQPEIVFGDLNVLKTLPEREFSAGMAEVIKHGMLADKSLFELLEKSPALNCDSEILESVIAKNCSIKAEVVSADEKELAKSGGRALLNLGHTFGHAIEAASGYGGYVHGEAVAIGLNLAAQLSGDKLGLSPQDQTRVLELLEKYNLPTELKSPISINLLKEKMLRDKKVREGKLRFVLMESIGKAVTVEGIEFSEIVPLWRGVGAE